LLMFGFLCILLVYVGGPYAFLIYFFAYLSKKYSKDIIALM